MDEIIGNDPAAVKRLMDAVESGKPVRVTEFARLVGRNETAIRRAWTKGSLPAAKNGCIPIREGIIALMANARKRPDFLKKAETRARELLGLAPAPKKVERPAVTEDDADAAQWRLKLLKAQTAAKIATTQATQLRNDIERGRLIERSEVELDAAETATSIARALSRLPERVAGMCVGCTADEIAVIVRREISDALKAIRDSVFAGGVGGEP